MNVTQYKVAFLKFPISYSAWTKWKKKWHFNDVRRCHAVILILTVWLTPHMKTLRRGSFARNSLTFWCLTRKCFFLSLLSPLDICNALDMFLVLVPPMNTSIHTPVIHSVKSFKQISYTVIIVKCLYGNINRGKKVQAWCNIRDEVPSIPYRGWLATELLLKMA